MMNSAILSMPTGPPLERPCRVGVDGLFEVACVSCSGLCAGDFLERDPCCDLPDVPCPCDDPVRCRGGSKYQVCEASCLSPGCGRRRAVDLSRLAVDRAFACRPQNRPPHRGTVRVFLGADALAF